MLRGFVLALFLLFGCLPKRNLAPIIVRSGYAYQQVSPTEYRVVAKTDADFDDALKEIGCGVCLIGRIGTGYTVTKPGTE